MLKKLIVTIFLIFTLNQKAEAVCINNPAQQLTTLTSLCYACMLPLSIAGVQIAQGIIPDPMGAVGSPICTCPMPPPIFIKIGIPISFYEPSRMLDVVKDPFCFESLGFGIPVSAAQGLLAGVKGNGEMDNNKNSFFQAHYMIYPVYSILEILTDFICLEMTGVDIGYMTEVDPLWQDDGLTALMQPEALLFANPISNFACMADSIASQVYAPLDPLFWCKGSWGNAYPMTGRVVSGDYITAAASAGASLIYKLHRQLIAWGSWGQAGLCGYYPAPIWRKSAYRMQLMAPVPNPLANVIGQHDMIWGAGRNIPGVSTNFGFMLFKKRECCAF